MSSEIRLLRELVFSHSFRKALSELASCERTKFISSKWGITVGFLDLTEVEKFGRLSMKTLTAATDRGMSTLVHSYKKTLSILAENGYEKEHIFYDFFESTSFSEFREIDGGIAGTSLEEAFYRFIKLEFNFGSPIPGLSDVLNHESLHSIARGLTTAEIAKSSVKHPLMRSTGCGMGGFLKTSSDNKELGETNPNNYWFYFGGKSFVRGKMAPQAMKIIKMAISINEPDQEIRRSAMSHCFPSNPILDRLIQIGII